MVYITACIIMTYWIMYFPLSDTLLQCPSIKYAERGTLAIINCSIDSVGYVYWYKDKSQRTTPLVKIENGKKYVLDGNMGHFDISDDGCLIIRNITKEDFESYDILHIREDNTIENASLELKVAKPPTKSCPHITRCEDCQNCIADGQDNQEITCSVSGTRPQVHVHFEVVEKRFYSVTNFSITEHYENLTDTWNTSSVINVVSSSCSSSIKLRCSVTGQNIFQLADSHAEFKTGICPTEKSEPSSQASEGNSYDLRFVSLTIAVLLIVVLILFCILFFVVCFCERNRNRYRAKELTGDTQMTEEPLIQNGAEDQNSYGNAKLLRHLRDVYQKLSYIKPLPWGQEMHIRDLYTASNFHVTRPDGIIYQCTSIDFLTCEDSNVTQRVLLVGDIGYGKTTFCQYVGWKWLEETVDQDEMMLFILPLKEVSLNTGIAEALQKNIPTDLNINVDFFVQILKIRKCRIILDGLHEAKHENDKSNKSHHSWGGDIEIDRLLEQPTLETYPKLQIWITSRDLDVNVSQPCTKIIMEQLTAEQLSKYATSVCKFYFSSIGLAQHNPVQEKNILQNAHSQEETRDGSQEDNDKNMRTALSEKVNYVEKTLRDNDLINDFSSCPLLAIMFIHIIASKEIQEDNSTSYNNLNFSSLVSVVVSCLEERYLQKSHHSVDREGIRRMKTCLAKLSLSDKKTIVSVWSLKDINHSLLPPENMDVAMAIGFLLLTKAKPNYSTCSSHDVTFLHPYIQEYIIAECISSTSKLLVPKSIISVSDRMGRIFQFICNMNNKLRPSVLEYLANNAFWDALIDCFYESSEDTQDKVVEKIHRVVKAMGLKMIIRNLHRRFHQKALMSFCYRSWRKRIFVKSMTLICSIEDSKNGRDFPKIYFDDFLSGIYLPKMEQLHIIRTNINWEDTVLSLLKATIYDKVSNVPFIRFQQCGMPTQISNLEKLKELSEFKISVTRTINECNEVERLDLENGTWNS